MHIDDLRQALHDEAQSMPVTDVTAADIRRRIAASRARALSAMTAVLLVMGMVGAVAVNPKSEGGDVTGLVAATGEAGSARFTMSGTSTVTLGPGEAPRTTTTAGEGLLDFARERLDLTMTGTATDEDGKEHQSVQRVISIGQDHWTSIPEDVRREEGIDASWYHSRSETNDDDDPFAGPVFDPDNVIEAMGEFAERVDREGEEEVRGVSTTRYNVVVDYAYLAGQQVDGDGTTSTTASAERIRDEMLYEMKIWIDGEGLLRRMETVIRSASPDEGGFESTSRMELFDFGVDTSSIQPPPPDQVIEQDEMHSQSAGRGNEPSGDGEASDGLWEEDLDHAPAPPGSTSYSCAESTPPTSTVESDGSVTFGTTCRAGAVGGEDGG